MKDLIDKTKKIARMAGQTQYSLSRLAKRISRISFFLAWIIIGMIATVGVAYFTPYEFSDPIIAPLIAIGAAILAILMRVSRIALRTTEYRVTETQYGRICQDADMLLIKMRGGDLSRAAAITELEKLNGYLYDLITRTTPVPHRILRRAGKAYDRGHPEYRDYAEQPESTDFLRAAAPRPSDGRKG